MEGARQRLSDRPDDEPAHQPAVAKAHFGLGRMHIDVDVARLAFDEQRRDRMAVAGEIIEIGGAQGAGE